MKRSMQARAVSDATTSGTWTRRHRDPRQTRVDSRENELLALLAPPLLARLAPQLQPVRLERKEILFHAHEPVRVVYFPTTAVVSLVARLESGDMVEVGLVGRDGLVGAGCFPETASMPYEAVVQIAGDALRLSADVLRREMHAHEPLSSVIGRYAQLLLVRSMQMSVCNMFHTVEMRCIRWLLTVSDLVRAARLPLTHELIATMLGVHRPTVTLVVGSLHRAGLVDEARGRIIIRDRARLEVACCECYRVMRDEQQRLLGR
jgi:CRP-like cAMP-binding protein